MLLQKLLARKVQLVNKFSALVDNFQTMGAKNIMTGVNVAFRMPGDSFVADQTDNPLTASPPEFAAGNTRTFFASRCRQCRPEK
jgi:hypothetical protein